MSEFESKQREAEQGSWETSSLGTLGNDQRRSAAKLSGYDAQSAALMPTASSVPRPVAQSASLDRARAIKKALLDGWFGEDEEGALQQIRGCSVAMVRAIRQAFMSLTGKRLERVFKDTCNDGQYREAIGIIWPALSLADKVETTINRWWIFDSDNEDGILDLIETASVAELRAGYGDQRFMNRLRDLLDDQQFFEACKIMAPDRMFDHVVERIKGANDWLNDDESGTYNAILELTTQQRRTLWECHQGLFDWMSGSELDRVRRMCTGTEAEALKIRMENATDGMGTDDDAVRLVVERTAAAAQREVELQGQLAAEGEHALSAAERAAAKAELDALGGIHKNLLTAQTWTSGHLRGNTFLGALSDDVSSSDFQRYAKQMGVSDFDRAKEAIMNAPGFFNDDEDAIKDAIRSVEDLSVRKRLWEDEDIRRALKVLGQGDYNTTFVLAQGSSYSKGLWELRQADGNGTKIYRALLAMSGEDRGRIRHENPPIMAELARDMDMQEWRIAEYIVDHGTMPTMMSAQVAMGSWYDGTDEDLLKLAFDHMDTATRAVYRLGYYASKNDVVEDDTHTARCRAAYEDLEEMLKGELGSRDLVLTVDKLLGSPSTTEMETAEGRMLAALILRTRVGEKTALDGGFSEFFTSTDETKDQAGTQVDAAFRLAIEDGQVDASELAVLGALDQRFTERYEDFVATAALVRNVAGTIAAVAAGIVVTVASGGTLGPAVAAVLTKFGAAGVVAAAGAAGAATRVGTSKAFGGDQYDTFGADGATDVVVGGIDGALTLLSAGLASRFTSFVGLSGEQLTAQVTGAVIKSSQGATKFMGGRAAGGAVEAAVDGVIGGAMGEVVFTLSDERVFQQSVWDVMLDVGGAMLRGGGIGGLTGGVIGGSGGAVGAGRQIESTRNTLGRFGDMGIPASVGDAMPMSTLRMAGAADGSFNAGRIHRGYGELASMQDRMGPTDFRQVGGSILDAHEASLTSYSSVRVQHLRRAGALENNAYHGSSGKLLTPEALGSEAAAGQLLSEHEMVNRGIRRVSGEGDTFSGRAGMKRDVYVGKGEAGLGTAAAYADLNMNSAHYNPAVMTWDDLTTQLNRAEELVTRFDELPAETVQAFLGRPKIESIRKKLYAEYQRRMSFPANHPVRLGGPENNSVYSVLFEMDASDMQIKMVPRRGGPFLAGEGTVQDVIDLPQAVRRVYVPEAHMDDALVRLRETLGHENFELLSFESVTTLGGGGHITGSYRASTEGLLGNEAHVDLLLQQYQSKLFEP